MNRFQRGVIGAIEAGRWIVVEKNGQRMVAWANSVTNGEKALTPKDSIAYVNGVLAQGRSLPMRIKHKAQRKMLSGG